MHGPIEYRVALGSHLKVEKLRLACSSDVVAKCLPARPVRDDTDRSLARSAWKGVPRKNRPVRVRDDRAQLVPEVYIIHLHESHRTLRDGSFGVAPFQATIAPSLRDISQQPNQVFKIWPTIRSSAVGDRSNVDSSF
jgi:hypothetical protein